MSPVPFWDWPPSVAIFLTDLSKSSSRPTQHRLKKGDLIRQYIQSLSIFGCFILLFFTRIFFFTFTSHCSCSHILLSLRSKLSFEIQASTAWTTRKMLIFVKSLSLTCHFQAKVHDGRGGPWHLTLRRWVFPPTQLLLHQLQPGRFVMSAPLAVIYLPLTGNRCLVRHHPHAYVCKTHTIQWASQALDWWPVWSFGSSAKSANCSF